LSERPPVISTRRPRSVSESMAKDDSDLGETDPELRPAGLRAVRSRPAEDLGGVDSAAALVGDCPSGVSRRLRGGVEGSDRMSTVGVSSTAESRCWRVERRSYACAMVCDRVRGRQCEASRCSRSCSDNSLSISAAG
jgi:hypothetical protein